MDDDRFTLADADWNDHYVLAEIDVELEISGTALVEVKMHDGVPQGIGTIEVAEFDDVVVNSPAPEW